MLVRPPPAPACAAAVWLGPAPVLPVPRRALVEVGVVVPCAVEAKEVAWQVALET